MKRFVTTSYSPTLKGPSGSDGKAKVVAPSPTDIDAARGSTPTDVAKLTLGYFESTQRTQMWTNAVSFSSVGFPVVISLTGKTGDHFFPQTR